MFLTTRKLIGALAVAIVALPIGAGEIPIRDFFKPSEFSDVMMSPEAVAALPEAERTLRDGMPVWATAGYATAVHAGTFGSLGLVLKKAWSVPLLIASLAGIVVQQIYIFFMSNAIEVYGAATMVFPVLVLLIGVYLVWYSRSAKQKGWIS